MSDELNLSIRRWRDALVHRESISTAQLDELQDHLEAELDRVPAEGFTEDERVMVAARRVGAPDELERQFRASNRGLVWSNRLTWVVGGYLAITVFSLVFDAVRDVGVLLLQATGVALPWRIAGTSLLISAGIAAVLGVSIPLLSRRSEEQAVWIPSRFGVLRKHPALTIGIGIALLPWLMTGIQIVRSFALVNGLGATGYSEFALATGIMNPYVPFAAPLTFFILASALNRRARASAG